MVVNGEQQIGEHKRTQWTPNTELQITRMAIAPNVDHKHHHHIGHINSNIMYRNTTALSPSTLSTR